jgi:phosphoribosylamine-glycine ligase
MVALPATPLPDYRDERLFVPRLRLMLTSHQDQGHHVFYDKSVKAREGRKKYNGLITSFGPVIRVYAIGNTIEEAHKRVYELVDQIYFFGKIYHDTIGTW